MVVMSVWVWSGRSNRCEQIARLWLYVYGYQWVIRKVGKCCVLQVMSG